MGNTCTRCLSFYEQRSNTSCAPCELQWVCSGVRQVIVVLSFPIFFATQKKNRTTVWQTPTCFHGDVSVPIQWVHENNTLCGAYSALVPVPLPLNTVFNEAVQRVASSLGMPDASLNPVGICGDVQRRGAWENSTCDVRARCNRVFLRGLYRVERTADP